MSIMLLKYARNSTIIYSEVIKCQDLKDAEESAENEVVATASEEEVVVNEAVLEETAE